MDGLSSSLAELADDSTAFASPRRSHRLSKASTHFPQAPVNGSTHVFQTIEIKDKNGFGGV
jgi:hypothetical protein